MTDSMYRPGYTTYKSCMQNTEIKCEWHTCESLFTLQSIPASCLSSPSGQGPLNLHAVKRIHTNTHPQCVQSSRHTHTHTHTHTTLKGEIHLFSHCALRLLSCPAKRGGRENKLLGISGLLSRQHSLQAKALQLTVKPHQPKWRAMKASCNNHVGPLSWQWLTNRMGKTQPLLSLSFLLSVCWRGRDTSATT